MNQSPSSPRLLAHDASHPQLRGVLVGRDALHVTRYTAQLHRPATPVTRGLSPSRAGRGAGQTGIRVRRRGRVLVHVPRHVPVRIRPCAPVPHPVISPAPRRRRIATVRVPVHMRDSGTAGPRSRAARAGRARPKTPAAARAPLRSLRRSRRATRTHRHGGTQRGAMRTVRPRRAQLTPAPPAPAAGAEQVLPLPVRRAAAAQRPRSARRLVAARLPGGSGLTAV